VIVLDDEEDGIDEGEKAESKVEDDLEQTVAVSAIHNTLSPKCQF
jgi:hypothetical protein